ncbi:Trk system potassium transporter TrkA [bacterium]|nr:Trk system potassium transporter TrkA [bacterium]
MKILVIGAGDVGYSLAERLSRENHDVTVIESNRDKAQYINEKLDVLMLTGNGASARLLEEAGIEQMDMMVAVTNRDEVNMLSCLLAREYKVRVKIARVANPEYSTDIPNFIKRKMGIDLIINPDFQVSDEIARILSFPEASDIARFGEGRIQLVDLVIHENDPLINTRLKDFFELKKQYAFLIVAILRGQRIIIPSGEDSIMPDDHLYLLGEAALMHDILGLLGRQMDSLTSLAIIGGGQIGGHLAQKLEPKIDRIKIIERDLEQCERLNERLTKSLILQADATDIETLMDEGLDQVDALVTATSNDKTNVLMSLLARHLKIRKIIAIIQDDRYNALLSSMGFDTVINPKRITADNIFKFMRRGTVLSMSSIAGDKAEILEFIPHSKSQIINIPLIQLTLPYGCIIGAIIHNDEVIIPSGTDKIFPADRVIVFSLRSNINKVELLFQ